jgi:ribokinase
MSTPDTKADVVVVGSLGMDYVFRAPRLPVAKETLAGSGFKMGPGSKGGNQAVALGRLGARVAMIAAVGDDANGAELVAGLTRDGVDCGFVHRAEGIVTGCAMVAVDDGGENAIIIVAGANAALTVAVVEARATLIDRARYVVCQMEVPAETVGWTLERARASGATVILNPAPILGPLPVDWLPAIDFLIPNEIEAEALTGIPIAASSANPDAAREAARRLLALGARNVLVTLGAHGVLAASADGEAHYPAVPVKAVDTTGAGDVFVGGFVAALSSGRPVSDAIRFGQQAASLSVTRPGAQAAIPYRRELPA